MSDVDARQTTSVFPISAEALRTTESITHAEVRSAEVRNMNADFPRESLSFKALK